MTATGFTLDTERAEQIGAQAEWLAEAADHGVPPGLHGCGAPRVIEAWDDYLGALTRTWSTDLLPALALWGSAVKSTVAWVRARDHAIAGLSTGSAAAIPGLDTTASTPAWTNYTATGPSGLTWEPGNPGLGQFTDTLATAHWFDRFTDHTAEVAGRFGALVDELSGVWTGTLAEAFIRLGRDLHQQLNQYATVLAYGYGGLALHQYTGQVEDIALRAHVVRGRLSDAHELLTRATSALSDLDEFENLTPAQEISRTRALNDQGTADDDIRILAAALSHLDAERFDADNQAINAAHQSHDGLAQITATPPGSAYGGSSTHTTPTITTTIHTTPTVAFPASTSTDDPAAPEPYEVPTAESRLQDEAENTWDRRTLHLPFQTSTEAEPPEPDGGDYAVYDNWGIGPAGGPIVWEPGPWPTPDPGAGPYNTTSPTLYDYLSHHLAAVAADAMKGIWPDAGRHLNHFLDNSGSPITLDVDAMLRGSQTFEAAVRNHRDGIIDIAFEAARGICTTEPITFPISSKWEGETLRDSDNWWYAVGSIHYSLQGFITITPPSAGSDEWTYVMETQVSVYDRYNWDGSKSTTIGPVEVTDEQLARLHRCGLGQEFDMSGTSARASESGTR